MSASPWETIPPPAPEAPGTGPAPAGWWRRVGATILDGIIVGIPVGIVLAAVGDSDTAGTFAGRGVVLLAFLVYSALMLAYRRGQTVGKGATSVRVLDEGYAPVGLGRAFGRELVKAIFQYTFVLYVLSVLWPLWQPENRALHDLVAGTRVVRADGEAPPA